ncbi:diacylglycerol kinase theta-like isoform X2 [Juglans microcarpa x Juglans regia]|uniref:diacylglycerol kinase theta-like isoform X2 n=1 Tax=Juglans microcarpa x Juglans regia TaxID=2249226 RepID=UPI001B7E8CE4|nr:diacylglycerol kinase theta-like isoform X2 [Juglans microcarpa x Juglans regia]
MIHQKRVNRSQMSNKTLNQTRSSLLNRSASMEFPYSPPYSTTFVPKKYSLIEYPTSPQLILGEEMLHFSHPQHPLSQLNLPDQFTCAGCKEDGAGMRFSCQSCDFQLHEFCALAPPDLKGHPLHFQHHLIFYSKPVKGGGVSKSKCDICCKPIKGFAFRCGACGFQMHPSCSQLASEINLSCHSHTLRLLTAYTTSNGDIPGFVCGECKRKRSGRVYHCRVCDYHLHAVCAKNMVNGLHDNGCNKGLEKPSMLAAAAKVASQVVGVIIEGIVEGFAQSVGEVFIQNVAKGNGHSRNNPSKQN